MANSGSEANDTQVKLVWYYNNALGRPEKKKFIARAKAYHGSTWISASLLGLPPLYQNFNLPHPFVQAVVKKYDILFIANEVISAFGRLGIMFGYMPIGVVMVSPQVIEVVYSQSNKLGKLKPVSNTHEC
ncbi:hypothetical protein GOBAR_DD24900 [Gossypium barbadense]|nr:hypothetical protein GOBAR_DD24900 [Gossypium barbadense]